MCAAVHGCTLNFNKSSKIIVIGEICGSLLVLFLTSHAMCVYVCVCIREWVCMRVYECVHVEGKWQFAGVSSFILLCGFHILRLGAKPPLLLSSSICLEVESSHLSLLRKEVKFPCSPALKLHGGWGRGFPRAKEWNASAKKSPGQVYFSYLPLVPLLFCLKIVAHTFNPT